MELSTAIKRLRGLRSQDEFAAEVGAHRVTVSLWETGDSTPSFKHARQLVALGLDPELFMPKARPTSDSGEAA